MRISDWSSDVCSSDLTEFNDLTFRSITSYRRSGEDINIDFDGGPTNTTNLGITRDSRTGFTQELQLLSDSSGPFDWVVGAFYYRADWNWNQFPLCLDGNDRDTPGCGPVTRKGRLSGRSVSVGVDRGGGGA